MMPLSRIAGSAFARVIAGYVAVAFVLAGAWLWSLSGPLTNAVVVQQERNLTAVAQSAALVVSESEREPQQVAQQLVARTDLRLTVVASDGTVLADSDYDPARMENHADRPEVSAALGGEVGVDRRTSATEGDEQIYVAVPGTVGGQRIAVRVAQTLDDVREIAGRLRRVGLLLLLGAVAAAVAIAWAITRSATRPVRRLSEAAERMADGNLSTALPEVPTDLHVLSASLARMQEQMRSRLDALDSQRLALRTTLDGLDDAVLLLDGETVRLANRTADRLLKPPPKGWEGVSLEDSGMAASLRSAIRERMIAEDSSAVDLEPDPTGRALRVIVAPLPNEGGATASIVVVSDVTERSGLDRMRREFVANASHELKTPVAGIGLLAESAASAAADGDDEQAMVFARQIASETGRLQRLVSELLDLSRLESLPAAGAVADVRVAIDNAVISHRSAAEGKGLMLEVDLSSVEDEDVFVAADATDLVIALDNLVDNAISYTEGGSVTVSVALRDQMVAVTVRDTGPGIPAEHLPRIFERFYRVDRSRSRSSGGTGLGLALVRHVAERNGGSVTVDSEVGRGSAFTLILPRA